MSLLRYLISDSDTGTRLAWVSMYKKSLWPLLPAIAALGPRAMARWPSYTFYTLASLVNIYSVSQKNGEVFGDIFGATVYHLSYKIII